MPATIALAIPEALPRTHAAALDALAGRDRAATGIRLGVLDNSKANAELLLRGLLERLGKSAGVASVLYTRKPNAAINAPREVLDRLAEGADIVISAMAD